jgi:hypothetical protein
MDRIILVMFLVLLPTITLIPSLFAPAREHFLKEYIAHRCSLEKCVVLLMYFGLRACFGYHKKEHIESLKRTNKIASHF